jgi:hypothetical protein
MTQDLQDLERDIEQSRAKLDLTIDRLQGKMTMSGVVDDMLGTARNGQYAPLFDNVLETIRRNPVPVMLMAMGIGLLAYRLGRKPVIVQRPIGLAAADDFAGDQNWADEVEDMRIQRSGMARGAASSAASGLSDTAPLPASDELFEERPRTTVSSRI